GRERRRLIACERVRDGTMSVSDAAAAIGLSVRQMRRSVRRYEATGDAGLAHRGRGRISNRRRDEVFRASVLERYRSRYAGFGPTLAAEKLAAEGLAVDHETLRRWLSATGDWQPHQRRVRHRSVRERKRHFGELVQLDGSHHDWFEGRRARCCVMQMIDDSTGIRLMHVCEQETTFDAMRLLAAWIARHGVPAALYTDRKTVYVTDREPTIEEQLAGREPLTAFGAACDMLGVRIIAASSPQAKGRIERANGVAQDRLTKELRLERVASVEGANELLAAGFVDDLNARFAVPPVDPTDFHRPLLPVEDLEAILAVRTPRTVRNDFTLRHEGRTLQILRQAGLPRPREHVSVIKRLDGTLHIEHHGQDLAFQDVTGRVAPKAVQEACERTVVIPGPEHPWRHGLPAT
ncbi:ISNCY family transposase, partial [bacterium]|nr:ISNCY family transposase [bacterium]